MPDNKLLKAKINGTKKEEEPEKKKSFSPFKKKIKNQYGKYSGIIDETGKSISNPTVGQSIKNMVNYLKNNTPESNVYRPEHAHTSLLYDKNKVVNNS